MYANRAQPNFADINHTILTDYSRYIQQWLPGGRFEGSEYTAINPRRQDHKAGSFKINWRTGRWSDFATGDRGITPISLFAYLTGLPYAQAGFRLAETLNGTSYLRIAKLEIRRPLLKPTNQANLDYALRLWNLSFPGRNTVVEKYLNSRNIVTGIPDDIRFLPGHKHKPSGQIYTVMLAAIRRWPSKELIAVHRTWLLPDGSGKAKIEPQRMMLGNSFGGAVQLSPAAEAMVICEGLETGLSVSQVAKLPVWAGLSTSGIKGVSLPNLPLGKNIIIACDNDMAGRKAAMQAAERWTKEDRIVQLAFPPENQDFNDLLMEQQS